MLRRLYVVLSSTSLVAKRSLSPGSGMFKPYLDFILMKSIHKTKDEKARDKTLSDKFEAKRAKNKASREKLARREERFAQAVDVPKNRIYDVGMKKGVDEFLFCVHLVSWEKENVSSEALEAARSACDKYMTEFAGKDAFHLWVRAHPSGTCARVALGHVLLSMRCKDKNGHNAQKALHRAKLKFPGRHKIIVSRKWEITIGNRADYKRYKTEGRIVLDGVNAKLLGRHGPLSNRKPGQASIDSTLTSVNA